METAKEFAVVFGAIFMAIAGVFVGLLGVVWVWENFGSLWGGFAIIAFVSALFTTMVVFDD